MVTLLSVCVCDLSVRLEYMRKPVLLLYYFLMECTWIYSLGQQMSGDSTDEAHPSSTPWFLTRSCANIWPETKVACHALQAGFCISLLMACLLAVRISSIVLGLWQGWARPFDRRTHPHDPEVADLDHLLELHDRSDVVTIHQQALSPVLAFFPEDRRGPFMQDK